MLLSTDLSIAEWESLLHDLNIAADSYEGSAQYINDAASLTPLARQQLADQFLRQARECRARADKINAALERVAV